MLNQTDAARMKYDFTQMQKQIIWALHEDHDFDHS